MAANAKISRINMIEGQLFTNQVDDKKLLEAISIVPREEFVPDEYKKSAYIDENIDIEESRQILAPLTTARMVQAAKIKGTEKILEIGCQTGYTTCLLAMLGGSVVAIESSSKLLGRASENLAKHSLENAQFVKSELREGLRRQAPYNLIIINGKVSDISVGIKSQLADNGKIVAIIENEDNPKGPGFISVITKRKNVFSCATFEQAHADYLEGFEKTEGFIF